MHKSGTCIGFTQEHISNSFICLIINSVRFIVLRMPTEPYMEARIKGGGMTCGTSRDLANPSTERNPPIKTIVTYVISEEDLPSEAFEDCGSV